MRTILRILATLTLLTASVRADETHANNFRYGQRALGMGGALTAVVGAAEATWYNPAGLAFLSGSVFSGSLQFYGFDERMVSDALRSPGDPSGDAMSTAFLPMPSSSVLSKQLVKPNARGVGSMVIALSTFVASARDENFHSALSADQSLYGEPGTMTRSTSKRTSDRMLYSGPTWAWRPSETFALGGSLFYVRRDQSTNHSGGYVTRQVGTGGHDEVNVSEFLDTTSATKVDDGALQAKLGVLWSPAESWTVGLAASTASVRLHGDGSIVYGLTFSGIRDHDRDDRRYPAKLNTDRKDIEATTEYPWRFGLGVAYTRPGSFTVAVDGDVQLPVTYERLVLDADAADLVKNHFVNRIDRQLVFNGAIGLEAWLSEDVVFRTGLFTNHSAAPPVPAKPTKPVLVDVDLYGASVSLGFRGGDRAVNVGVEVQMGAGDDAVLDDITSLWKPKFSRTRREHQRVLFFLSGAMDFAKKTARDIVEEEDGAKSPSP